MAVLCDANEAQSIRGFSSNNPLDDCDVSAPKADKLASFFGVKT